MSTNLSRSAEPAFSNSLHALILAALDGMTLERGNVVDQWPADEAAAYRDHGGFQEGLEAVQAVRREKMAAFLRTHEEAFRG